MLRSRVPEIRRRDVNAAPIEPRGAWVLYWMVAARRPVWNFALERAIEWAADLGKPLLVLEALRCDYPYASDRLHRFVLDGMEDNAAAFADTAVGYLPYVEPRRGAGKGLLEALARDACLVVTDDLPAFFLPRMQARAGARLRIRLETVDSNGLLPFRAADRAFPTAWSFRRFLQKVLPEHLRATPSANPLAKVDLPPAPPLPAAIRKRWPLATPGWLGAESSLARLPLDHDVGPAPLRGGSSAAGRRWKSFVATHLDRYAEDRNHPDEDATSGISPYLHFGHVSAHQLFHSLTRRESWRPGAEAGRVTGKARGWWRLRASTEAFLDQLITWRELGLNFCSRRDDYDRYESLPDWALKTLRKHARDRRPVLYDEPTLRDARTNDEVWNAAQRQLLRDGRIHNYLRMLWGKKVLEWSSDPETALTRLIELNDRYALDGRDPNSYSGIFWVFGRYDRAWGPERPIFGTVRYMTSQSALRKLRMKTYLERYGGEEAPSAFRAGRGPREES